MTQRFNPVRLGAIAWLLSGVFFVAQAIAQLFFTPAFSLLDDRVSDLGNTACGAWLTYAFACSPLHDWVNGAFVVTGLSFILGAALTWSAWPPRRLTTAGLTCVSLAGLGFVLVGLNPENVNVRLHVLGASNLIFSNVALLLLGLATRAEHSWRSTFALIMAAIGILGVLSGVPLLAIVHHGGGLSERLALYPLAVYVILVGAWLLRTTGSQIDRHGPTPTVRTPFQPHRAS